MRQQTLSQQHKKGKHKAWYRLRKRQDDRETTRHYTEQEIQSLAHSTVNSAGIIRPATGDLHMPSDLVDRVDGQQKDRPPSVLLVIITLALIFIAIITYFVAQMPPKN